ncbi:MAG: tRNA (adenosine(37)-N6)-threonylcarbamoyltransferase complex dimerization subunit type 1 TsaB [Leptospirillia bacterium]
MTKRIARPYLAIDTSTPLGGVALVGPSGLIAEHAEDVQGSHSPRLMEMVARILERCDVPLSELGGLGVSIGPGSFTGLRVGIATVLGLSRSADLPVFPVPTLEALAWGVPRPAGYGFIVTVMASRKGEIYGAVYRHLADGAGSRLEAVSEPVVATPEAFSAHLEGLGQPLLLTGTATAEVALELDRFNTAYTAAAAVFHRPRAAVVAWRAAQMAAAGAHYDVADITPLYLAKSQAEIAWAARRQAEA